VTQPSGSPKKERLPRRERVAPVAAAVGAAGERPAVAAARHVGAAAGLSRDRHTERVNRCSLHHVCRRVVSHPRTAAVWQSERGVSDRRGGHGQSGVGGLGLVVVVDDDAFDHWVAVRALGGGGLGVLRMLVGWMERGGDGREMSGLVRVSG